MQFLLFSFRHGQQEQPVKRMFVLFVDQMFIVLEKKSSVSHPPPLRVYCCCDNCFEEG